MSAASDNFENKMVDWLLRGQAIGLAGASAAAGTGPTQVFVSLKAAADSDNAQGAEVSGGSYARVAVPCSLAAWAGTQGAGTTTASSGSSGTTSNNAAVTFPVPSAAWGQVVGFGVHDSAVGGIEMFYAPLGAPKTINNGDPAPSFAAGALTVQLDN
ncbi:hypothetical protein ACHAC9_22285 [Massilia sp. CMS3.1]|uniref:phage tail fiber protein n=1 Tax=Massilia sp. CMS3.1 TaxID=3373083 RepID=UPI003EE46240